jgi:hypothetical protein
MAATPDIDDIGGVWATDFRMAVTEDGLTLEFIRVDPFDGAAVVVSRVACSHATMGDLVEDLAGHWQDWIWHSSPPEER